MHGTSTSHGKVAVFGLCGCRPWQGDGARPTAFAKELHVDADRRTGTTEYAERCDGIQVVEASLLLQELGVLGGGGGGNGRGGFVGIW